MVIGWRAAGSARLSQVLSSLPETAIPHFFFPSLSHFTSTKVSTASSPPRPFQNFLRHVHDHDHDSSSPTLVTIYPSSRLDYRPDCSARRVPSCTLNLILSSNFQTWVLCHSISLYCSISSSTTSNLFLLLTFAKQPDRRILCPRLMIARFLGRH